MSLLKLLEEKRISLDENHTAFSARMLPDGQKENKATWCRARLRRINLPKSWLPKAAKLLGLPLSEVRTLWREDADLVGTGIDVPMNVPDLRKRFTAAQLRKFADIVERVGSPMSIQAILVVIGEIRE